MNAQTTPAHVHITGRRWTDKHNNTYHTARVTFDGIQVASVPLTYGYERAFEDTAAKALEDAGLMPGRIHHANGAAQPAWQYFKDRGCNFTSEAVDVQRRKDL